MSDTYYVIRYYPTKSRDFTFITYGTRNDETYDGTVRFQHKGRSSWMLWLPTFEICSTYEVDDNDLVVGTNKTVEQQFYIDYPKLPTKDSDLEEGNINGWLLPDGNFYGCFYTEHDATLVHLGGQFLQETSFIKLSQIVTKKGWLAISSHVVTTNTSVITQEQQSFIDRHQIEHEELLT